ncbi:hypothetical protein D3C72_1232700 [compost metagenome]
MLIRIPKVSFGRRLSAIISSDIGIALDTSATTSPASRIFGSSSAAPACTTPTGTTTSDAASSPSDTECPACRWPARLPNTMYRPQQAAAPIAYSTPTGSSAGPPPIGSNNSSPTAAQPTQRKSIGRRDDSIATVNGPVNSMATAMPNGIVRKAM